MLSEQLKNKLIENKSLPKENVGRLVGRLARYIHIWHEERNPYPEVCKISSSLAALLYNIDLDGSQNKDLSRCAFSSKQAMSKLLIQTEKEGLIAIEKNKEDNRANEINLTNSGAEILIAIGDNNRKLIEEFENLLGKEKMQQLLELLFELTEGLEINSRKF